MPTARPIISARVGVEVFTSVKAATDSTPHIARATPRIAVTIGMPAASSDPKVTARTTRATRTPIPSVAETWTDLLVKIWPPRCTSSDDDSGSALAAFSRSSMVESCSRSRGTSSWTRTSASRWFSERLSRLFLSKGSVASSTWSTLRTLATTCSTSSRWSLICSPSGATSRIWPEVPAASGKRCASTSRPSCDSVPGMVRLSWRLPPSPTATAPARSSASMASASTRFARRTMTCPRR